MKTYFYLSHKRTNAKGKAPVYCRIQDSMTNRSDYSTGIFVYPKEWDEKKGFVKPSNNYEYTLLTQIQQKAQKAIIEASVNGIISTSQICKIAKGEKKTVYNKLSQVLPSFIAHSRPSKHVLSRITFAVKEFEGYIKNSIQDLRIDTPTTFENRLYERGLQSSTIYKRQEILKRIFEYCTNMNYIPQNPYRMYKLPTVKPKAQIHISLTELNDLEKKVFAQDRLNKVKDVLLFQCYTGLAYVDLKSFCMSKIKTIGGMKYIIGERKKTGTPYHIPLLLKAETILNEYEKLPVLCNQKYNSYLKEIADLMGWKMQLTTHVGRKTFAQIMLNKGVSWEAIASMMGHEKTTMTEKHYATIGFERVESEVLKMVA